MKVSHIAPLFALSMFGFAATVCSAASFPGIVAGVPRGRELHDLGRAAATTRLSVGIMLAYRNPVELERLLDAQADPDSTQYHRFLTRQQFNDRYAPSSTDYQRTIASLQRGGFLITRTFHNRTFVDASAPLSTVERYFQTQIHRVAQMGHGERFANVRPATPPSELHGIITGVAGLDNLVRFHTNNHLANRHRPEFVPPAKFNAPVSNPLFGPDTGYGPRAFIGAYHLPSGIASGKGQTSAVVIDADFLDSDLASYLRYFGVTRTGPPTTRVRVRGGPPPGVSPDSFETTLDVETLVSLAPATSLYVYEIPSLSDRDILEGYEQAIDDGVAGTVNSSFSGCEEPFGSSFPQLSDQLAVQGASLGMTFHASTGDQGSVGSGCFSTTVQSPASNPHFVAVGGTSLYEDPSSGALLHEFAWSGSGGGFSVLYSLPSYQQGVAHIVPFGRNLPDVSFDADPATGESFFYSGIPRFTGFIGPIGGTSLSSPIFGAGLTLVNQIQRSRAGFVNPRIYRTFRKYGYRGLTALGGAAIFRDITFGSNGFYSAGPGYDQVTGIGTMDFTNFAHLIR